MCRLPFLRAFSPEVRRRMAGSERKAAGRRRASLLKRQAAPVETGAAGDGEELGGVLNKVEVTAHGFWGDKRGDEGDASQNRGVHREYQP